MKPKTTEQILQAMCRCDGCPNLAEHGQSTCCACRKQKATRACDEWVAVKAEHERTHGALGDASSRLNLMPLIDHRSDMDNCTGA